MCVVSMVTDHYRDKWPYVPPTWTTPIIWPPVETTPNLPTPNEYADYKELLRKAREYDRLTAQPDCPAPEKVEWQRALEKFMRERYGIEPKP